MYKNIMVAIDDSETSRCALVEAAHIARCSNAKLYVTHVADETLMGMHGRTFSTTMNLDHALAAIAEAGRKLLDEAMQGITGLDAEPLLLEARQRRVSETLADKARELGCDLIIIGRRYPEACVYGRTTNYMDFSDFHDAETGKNPAIRGGVMWKRNLKQVEEVDANAIKEDVQVIGTSVRLRANNGRRADTEVEYRLAKGFIR